MADLGRAQLRAVVVLAAAGAALRFSTLGVQSFWSDEAVTAQLVHQGLGHMLSDLPRSESTPPLFYVVAWLWTRVFGVSEAGLRSLSALAGTLTIPVAFMLARRLASERAGLIAAALVAVNPLLWWYSQEARSYGLLVLFAAAATAVFVDLVRGGRRVALWAVLAALALATHYFALFVVGPQAAWLAWRAWRARERRGLVALGGVALAGLALLPLAIRQASNHAADFIHTSQSLAFRVAQVPKQFLIGFDAPLETAATVVAALIALVGLALFARAPERERRGAVLLAAIAAIALALPALLAVFGADYLITRNLIAALVPGLAVLAIGMSTGRLGALAAAALCAVSVATVIAVMTTPAYQRDDWRGAARALGPATTARVVVFTPSEGRAAMEWYLHGAREIGVDTIAVPELDLIGLGQRTAGQKPNPPRGPAPVPQGFAPVRRIEDPTFTAIVNRAATPVGVNYLFGAANRLSPSAADVLYQPAR